METEINQLGLALLIILLALPIVGVAICLTSERPHLPRRRKINHANRLFKTIH